MSVVCDERYKNTVGARICVRLARAIKAREIRDKELPEVCHFVLVAIKSVETMGGMIDFLSTLAARWPIFTDVYQAERNQTQQVHT